MPRNRPRKTDRGTKDLLLYEQAYEEILKGRSVRAAARMSLRFKLVISKKCFCNKLHLGYFNLYL